MSKTNGVSISVDEFKRLPVKQQNTILFENTETIKEWMGFRKVREAVQEGSIAILMVGIGVLLKKVFWP